jgi:hypothetical protein
VSRDARDGEIGLQVFLLTSCGQGAVCDDLRRGVVQGRRAMSFGAEPGCTLDQETQETTLIPAPLLALVPSEILARRVAGQEA